MATGGERRWQEYLEPNARSIVRQRMVTKLTELFKADPRASPQKLGLFVANVEQGAFSVAQSKADYMRMIAMKLQSLAQDQQRALRAAAENPKQQMQIAHQMQLGHPVQIVQGGSLLAMTQAASVTASPIRPSSQQSDGHTAGPNMQIRLSNQNFNSQSAIFAPMASCVQSGQQKVQSIPMQSQNKCQAVQLQHTNFNSCNQASVAQLQGQPVVRPKEQPNHFLNQNASGICGVQQQPTRFLRNHQGLVVNQHHTNSQWHQMVGANNMAKLNIGYPRGSTIHKDVGCTAGEEPSFKAWEQEMLRKQTNMESQLITPETTNCDEAVDWREKMFRQIESWKAAYLSDIMELNQILVIPERMEEQLQSLPKCKAEAYKRNLFVKSIITSVLEFLQLQKSEIPETYREKLPKYKTAIDKLIDYHRKAKACIKGSNIGQESQDCHGKRQIIGTTGDTTPFSDGKSSQENQPKQPADASIHQTRQKVVTITTPAYQKIDSRDPQGVRSPCFSVKSPGGLQSLPTYDVGVCCTLPPAAKSGVIQVASPYSSLNFTNQSPNAKPGVVVEASACASVKSSSTSKSNILAAVSPCLSVKSTFLSNAAKSGVVRVTSPCDSVKSTGQDDINNQVTPPKLACLGPTQTAASQSEDEVSGIAKTLVAKKPMDRLLDAVRAASPSVLHSSVNSIKLALIEMDSVLLPRWSESNNKMKRAYDVTLSCSGSPHLGSLSGDVYVTEHGAKRQKTQNAKEFLFDEIEATNSKLIDTTISILGGNSADGITSCNGGTLMKLLYTRVSLATSLKSHPLTSKMQPLVMPVTLLVPADYPASSPTIIYDEGDEKLRKKYSSISEEVDATFRRALRTLPEPRSLKETASAWDACVRRAVTDFVRQHPGGVLGLRPGRWESCVSA